MNEFELYVELASNPLHGKFKNTFNKVLAFFRTKQEEFYDIMAERQRQKLYQITTDAPKIIEIIEKITKQIINQNKKELSVQLINEEEIQPPSVFEIKKELAEKISKGFIPSATFYPAFKMFEQFFMLLRKEIKFNEITLNLNSNELLSICAFIFIYVFYKIIKESYVIKKEYVAKKIKEREEKKKIKERINKELNRELDKKIWKKEDMDEWLNQKLWSPEELERMIEKKMKEKQFFEDKIYSSYMERASTTSTPVIAEKFVNFIKKFRMPGKNHKIIEHKIGQLLNKLETEDALKIIKELEGINIINEEYYDEGFIKSLKEFISEIFPSLTFYPALQAWMILEKAIGKQTLSVLTEMEINQLKTYVAVFVGLVGVKIATNRIKDTIEDKKAKELIDELDDELEDEFMGE
jgi:hypothetical protein